MKMSIQDKYYTKVVIGLVTFLLVNFGFGTSGEILGGQKALMSLVPVLLMWRFLWSDVWIPGESSSIALKISRWFVFPFLALVVAMAYAL